jgi:NADPH:quinone reductase-like Zn-dependent oxidoreductase
MSSTDGTHEPGSLEAPALSASLDHEPGPGEVRLSVQAIGIDRVEKAFEPSPFGVKSKSPPLIEYDVVGEVEAVGPGVAKVRVGERVAAIPSLSTRRAGVYTDLAVFPVEAVLPWPASLDAKQAAALWTPWLTAWGGLVKRGGLRRGQVVLLTAAHRSAAIAAIQTVSAAGAVAVAIVRNTIRQDELRAAGAAHVVDTAIDDLRARVLDITNGRGADLAFDGIGGPQLDSVAESMAPGGRIILYGHLDDPWTHIPIVPMLEQALSLQAHSIRHTTSDPDAFAAAVEAILRGVEQGNYHPIVDRTFPVSEILEAHRYLDSFECLGKVVVLPGGVGAKG